MATCTIGCNGDVGVVHGRQPVRVASFMTARAIGRGRDVVTGFAGCFYAVMAARTVGGAREAAVINTGGRQPCCGFVAAVARSDGGEMA